MCVGDGAYYSNWEVILSQSLPYLDCSLDRLKWYAADALQETKRMTQKQQQQQSSHRDVGNIVCLGFGKDLEQKWLYLL